MIAQGHLWTAFASILLWSHIPNLAVLSDASNTPQHNIGSYLDLCIPQGHLGTPRRGGAREMAQCFGVLDDSALACEVACRQKLLTAARSVPNPP